MTEKRVTSMIRRDVSRRSLPGDTRGPDSRILLGGEGIAPRLSDFLWYRNRLVFRRYRPSPWSLASAPSRQCHGTLAVQDMETATPSSLPCAEA